ncbi:MAG: GH3 auxin-responsive promoter family protein [Planctomycetes bacterium]|nr:GH3 auxin-responsive promoter family protein [Planctomycetota bacterium]
MLGAGLSLKLARRARRLSDSAYWTSHTARIQARQLRRLLSVAKDTQFGRAHDFARIARTTDDAAMIDAYRAAVPLADWYAFKDPLERMRLQGERDVLWPGLVRDFCQTSGTTAGDKFIPVSSWMLRSNHAAAMDIFANLIRRDVSIARLFCGKCLFLGGSSAVSTNEHGVRTGDLSGLVTGLIRWPLTEIYSPGPDIALMDDWPRKIEAMAQLAIRQDIRMISGMPSWAHVLMDRVLELARQRAPTQGQDGSCIRRVWPNLELFVHGGVRYEPFESRMREVYSGSATGDDFPHRLELYPASEGFIAMQDARWDSAPSGRSPPLRLNTDIGLFYEFVPLESIDDPDAPAFTCDRVEPGVRYVVVLTTCAGLWRYILGDVVEFDSCPNGLDGSSGWSDGGGPGGPSRLRIVGRHRHFINAFGENLIVEHIETAAAHAARAVGVVIGEFTAAPVYPSADRRAGLELAVEIKGGLPDAASHASFPNAFDDALKSQNVDYTTKRGADMGMAPPTITTLEPGAFHRWLDARGKLGGQHKCPRCANTREILEAVVGVDRDGD